MVKFMLMFPFIFGVVSCAAAPNLKFSEMGGKAFIFEVAEKGGTSNDGKSLYFSSDAKDFAKGKGDSYGEALTNEGHVDQADHTKFIPYPQAALIDDTTAVYGGKYNTGTSDSEWYFKVKLDGGKAKLYTFKGGDVLDTVEKADVTTAASIYVFKAK